MSNFIDWPEAAKNEISRLESDNDMLQQEVGRSVAKIISLQGEDRQILDGDLKRRFEEICFNIEDWTTAVEVEFLQQGREFCEVFDRILEHRSGGELLHRWGFLESPHDLDDDIGKLYWIGQLDTCIKVVFSRVIWQSLYAGIFGEQFPIGTKGAAVSGLQYITDAIKHGPDGIITEETILRSNKWRSSAVCSLATTEWFQSTRETQLTKILGSLRDTLTSDPLLLDKNTFSKNASKLRDDIILAAANLKQEMTCSAFEYSIIDPYGRPSLQTQLHESTLKDIETWRVVAQSQCVGGILLCLFPGVYKRTGEDGKLSTLVKPVLFTHHQKAAKILQALQLELVQSKEEQLQRKSKSRSSTHRADGKQDEETIRRGKQQDKFKWIKRMLQGLLNNSIK